jgi:hypothetical protein
MGSNMFNLGIRSKTLWRPVLGLLVAYAVAAQSLLIAAGGFALPAHADANAPAFELCLHGAHDVPSAPADHSGHSGCTHCIFCFAGAHHAVIVFPTAAFHRAVVVITRTGRAPPPRADDRQPL